jgi:hypothetical protein
MGRIEGGYRGPDIVSNGLVLYLDAGSPNSYRLDYGNTWRDISGNDRNATLNNGPTFNSENGGSIVFDGTNDYANNSNAGIVITNFTIEMFVYPITAQVDFERYCDATVGGGNANAFRLYQQSGRGFGMDLSNAQFESFTGATTNNAWNQIAVTANGTNVIFYVNGSVNRTHTSVTVATNVSRGYTIGAVGAGSEAANIRCAIVRWYNKGLTSTEILQNYNANKSRFGL